MTRTRTLKFRVSDVEYDALVGRAVREDTTLSTLIRVGLGLEPVAHSTYATRYEAHAGRYAKARFARLGRT